MDEYNNNKKQIFLPIILALVLIAGILIGNKLNFVKDRQSAKNTQTNYSKINDIINYIKDSYVDTVNNNKLEEKAIEGMLKSLDPFSEYIPYEKFNEVNDPLLGKFEGIGVQFRIEKDTVVVINTVPGGPSSKLGIKAGDRIVYIDGMKNVGKNIKNIDIMKKLKGKKGTKVKVGIFRKSLGKLIDFTITRDVIPTYSIDAAYMIKENIGFIRLNKFSATTGKEFSEALQILKNQGCKKLIIDLRDNGGGYMEAAIHTADELLGKGKLIVYTEGLNSPRKNVYATGGGIFESEPVVVLIDDFSASASEILAGAIQDNDRGTIVGRRSFGKGLVQQQLQLSDGSAIRLTIARYHTPTGRCIQKPYEESRDDYYEKIMENIYKEDSSSQGDKPDSKEQYKTPGGKIVYGGGGITPDIVIDKKNKYPALYIKAMNTGLLQQFAFDFTDNNRKVLNQYKDFELFNKNYNINICYNEFIALFEKKNKNKVENTDKLAAETYIKTYLKASIARYLFDDKAFFTIINNMDFTVKKALEVISSE